MELTFREHLNGKRGYSLWMSRDPVDKVTATYAALNQLQCKLHKKTGELVLLSAARLLEYGVRIVHEDMHNHYAGFNSVSNAAYFNLLKMKRSEPAIAKALDTLKDVEEVYVHEIQGDFAEYFLSRLLKDRILPPHMPFYHVQFPPGEDVIQIVGDKKTLPYLGEDENMDFKFIWDEPMLWPKDKQSEKAEEKLQKWLPYFDKTTTSDRREFITKTSETLSRIVSLPPAEFREEAVLNMARKRIYKLG